MHSRLHPLLVTLGIVLLCLIPLAIFFLGGASVSGGKLLNYPSGHSPSEEQYASDEKFLCEIFERSGFQKVAKSRVPPRRVPPEGFTETAAFEFPMAHTTPIFLKLYRDPKRSGFWVSTEAHHPTWAVAFAKPVIKKSRDPLSAAWESHLAAPR